MEAKRQGEVFHRYILGVYDLYERLILAFPHILFESCASGGGRFDAGMLYYAPQAWTSDDSDAVERLKIQYGTSFSYPLSSMGAHVSVTPNHQLGRVTPLKFRGDVAAFGAFGYEMDLGKLSEAEHEVIRAQVAFVKRYRELIHKGTFYRLLSPFEGNFTAWMVVSEDRRQALVAVYKVLNDVNCEYRRLKLHGLAEETVYRIREDGCDKGARSGSELMRIGMVTTDDSAGERRAETAYGDFYSRIFVLEAEA